MKVANNQLTLGEFIDALWKQPQDHSVNFDFCMLGPTSLASYRGYYEDLALGFTSDQQWNDPTVAKLLAILEAAVGQTFVGWKGGSYTAGLSTAMWVANRGETGGTAIVGVEHRGHWTSIETEMVD